MLCDFVDVEVADRFGDFAGMVISRHDFQAPGWKSLCLLGVVGISGFLDDMVCFDYLLLGIRMS